MLVMDTSYKFTSDLNIKRGGNIMNGNSGIQPTVELATTNGNGGFAYPYPAYPMMGGNCGFGGFGSDSAIWLIVLLALIWGNGNGNGFGGFGGNSFDNGYAWLSNGQKEIMNNTNNGFDTLHLSNQLEGTRDGINSLSNQLCSCCADITGAINNTAYNAEIAASNRQMANMQQAFDLSRQFADCCCENRLASCQTQNAIVSEAAATRFADANNTRDIITSQTQGTQAILDKLCQLELDGVKAQVDAKNDRIAELQTQLNMANLAASQTAQTADIRANNAVVANQLVSELRSCPIPAQPVYGNQPIFTCPNNLGYGCGCTGTSQFI